MFGKRHKIMFGMRRAMNTQSEKGLKQSKDAADTGGVSHRILTPMFTWRVQE